MAEERERGQKRAALTTGMAEMLPDLQATMLSAITAAMDAGLNRMSTKMEDQFNEFDKGIQQQFAAQQAQISALNERISTATSSTRDLSAVVKRMDDTLAAVESQTPLHLDTEGFDRAIDITIVQARTAEKVSKAKLLEALQSTIDDMRLPPGQVQVDGAEID